MRKNPQRIGESRAQAEKLVHISWLLVGTPDAVTRRIMARTRSTLVIVSAVIAMLLATGAPLFAACAAAQAPDCHKTARFTPCCCCDDREISNQPGVAQAMMEIGGDHQRAVSDVTSALKTEMPRAGTTSWHVDTSPPYSPDLPILLADLRL